MGTLIGMIFLNPIFRGRRGASFGAISGALTDLRIDDQMMKDVAAKLSPNTSALFVLVRLGHLTADKVVLRFRSMAGLSPTVAEPR